MKLNPCFMYCCICLFYLSAQADTATNPFIQLSVEQTVQFAKGELTFERGYYGLRSANPAARKQLYQLLEDNDQKGRWPKIILTMCYIGEKEDVSKLGDFIAKIGPDQRNNGYNTIYAYFNALATMADRGVEGAADQLYKMASPDLWDKRQFNNVTDEEFHIAKSGVIAWHAIISARFYTEPKASEHFAPTIESVKDAATKKLLLDALKDLPDAQRQWLQTRAKLENEYREKRNGTWHEPPQPPVQR